MSFKRKTMAALLAFAMTTTVFSSTASAVSPIKPPNPAEILTPNAVLPSNTIDVGNPDLGSEENGVCINGVCYENNVIRFHDVAPMSTFTLTGTTTENTIVIDCAVSFNLNIKDLNMNTETSPISFTDKATGMIVMSVIVRNNKLTTVDKSTPAISNVSDLILRGENISETDFSQLVVEGGINVNNSGYLALLRSFELLVSGKDHAIQGGSNAEFHLSDYTKLTALSKNANPIEFRTTDLSSRLGAINVNITNSQLENEDRIMKLWNFENGVKKDLHTVSLPAGYNRISTNHNIASPADRNNTPVQIDMYLEAEQEPYAYLTTNGTPWFIPQTNFRTLLVAQEKK